MSDTIAKLRELLLHRSKAGMLRGLLDQEQQQSAPTWNGMLGGLAGAPSELPYKGTEMTPERIRSGLSGLVDMTPVVGDAKSAYEGVQAAREGDWGGAGLGMLGALPFVPGMINPKIFGKASGFEKSAMVDKSDTLIPLYHGGKSLEEGMPNKGSGIYGEGLYLTGLPGRTQSYTKAPNSATYQVFANMRNPISSDDFRKRFGSLALSPQEAKKVTETLKAEGYDGVVSKHGDDVWEAVSFYPDRDVKSAISGISGKQQVKAKDDLYLESLERMINK